MKRKVLDLIYLNLFKIIGMMTYIVYYDKNIEKIGFK